MNQQQQKETNNKKNPEKNPKEHQSHLAESYWQEDFCHHIGGQSVESRYFSVLGTTILPEKQMGPQSVMQEEEVNIGAERV